MFDAGIDIVVLDTYYPERDRLHAEVFGMSSDIKVYDFYEDEECPSPYTNHHRKLTNVVIVMDDISKRQGASRIRKLNNQAGNAGDGTLLNLKKKCTLPFRELTIRCDGDVCICCMDVGHEYVCGNVLESTLMDIWYGEQFEAARKVLYSKRRDFNPCVRCDSSAGTRVGLLPLYESPSLKDIRIVNTVISDTVPRNGFPIVLCTEECHV